MTRDARPDDLGGEAPGGTGQQLDHPRRHRGFVVHVMLAGAHHTIDLHRQPGTGHRLRHVGRQRPGLLAIVAHPPNPAVALGTHLQFGEHLGSFDGRHLSQAARPTLSGEGLPILVPPQGVAE